MRQDLSNRPIPPMTNELRAVLDPIVKINDKAWQEFELGITHDTIKKGGLLWDIGQICNSLVFLRTGLIRSYSFQHEKEVTHTFYVDKDLFYDDYSFLSQKPCRKMYEAIEDCELLLIHRSHLLSMYDRHKCFERLGRLALERTHVNMMEHMERISLDHARDNYRYLVTNHPSLLQRVPQKIIASYLNITPEHLSRIRAKS